MGETETLKEISGELAVIREALERAEISERMLTGIHRELEAERDQLRVHVADLRAALEPFATGCVVECLSREDYSVMRERIVDWHGPTDFRNASAALDRTPAQSLARVKAEALEEVSKELRTAIDHVLCGCYNESDIGGLQLALAKVAQLGKQAGACLKCSYANVEGEKVAYQRCADCDAEADRLTAEAEKEAANGNN